MAMGADAPHRSRVGRVARFAGRYRVYIPPRLPLARIRRHGHAAANRWLTTGRFHPFIAISLHYRVAAHLEAFIQARNAIPLNSATPAAVAIYSCGFLHADISPPERPAGRRIF